jgi:hypothetical protein
MSKKVEEAVQTLREAFKNDPDFRDTYKANIAVCMQDEHHEYTKKGKKHVGVKAIHEISNKGADRFLDLFCQQE